ncbi:hypothetical protein DM02DRAFT_617813 [Periconia macrospinosa]|uniref:Uncharacterized protein n=1 Tax=Periconia macrospinosa TaxID=97972 RepID=A0A2V1DBU5_9PLEO|nr:hypothetical protein DM02DRAFT_617813 [Periconia macrospinosa]
MGAGHAALISLRVLALVVMMGVVALTAWSKIIIIDIERRGASVVDTMIFNTEADREAWRSFFSVVLNNGFKIWIALACGSFTILATLTVLLSNLIAKLHLRPLITIPLQALSTLATTTAFAFTLSATLSLTNFTFSASYASAPGMTFLDTSTSRDLKTFSAMPPFSQTYTIGSGSAALLLGITTVASLIQSCCAGRSGKACSFEPTASRLGMSHGYQADEPTMFDPAKPEPAAVMMMDEEKGSLLGGAADMGGRRSPDGSVRMGMGGQQELSDGISGPLGLKKPEDVVLMRPARPWSEMPKPR